MADRHHGVRTACQDACAGLTARPADTLWEGAILKARLIFPPVRLSTLYNSSHTLICDLVSQLPASPLSLRCALIKGIADDKEYPLLPPKMVFDSEMWHPNGQLKHKRLFIN